MMRTILIAAAASLLLAGSAPAQFTGGPVFQRTPAAPGPGHEMWPGPGDEHRWRNDRYHGKGRSGHGKQIKYVRS